MAGSTLDEDTPIIVLKSVFKYYDKDGNGKLDMNEFRKYLVNVGLNGFDDDAINALADDDGDATINFNEFVNLIKKDKIGKIASNTDKFDFLCQISELFKQYDANGDGKITYDEWKQFFINNGNTEDEAKAMFGTYDANNNNSITFDEFWKGIYKLSYGDDGAGELKYDVVILILFLMFAILYKHIYIFYGVIILVILVIKKKSNKQMMRKKLEIKLNWWK